ncbi:WecB/TagA/CpsF family glycosyltransferase [Starkeya koreensis]|uniref:WecB/TagA/CpsF family glycosyltransferase n=1 Tax=Ancylobacter koreensis TaxID=266121 RepID=A0ABT0DQ47_9HYPH|nr:WecB/TagA/CpsF family glycosyltransferase [Ancylobacter koreensis]MCK0209390.1 WecB/TagA/CpsF family glycosyltransferase [Ancylobacter koreensis]
MADASGELADGPAAGRAGDVAGTPPQAEFLGVPIARLDAGEAAALIAARPADAPFAYVVTPNAAHLNRLTRLADTRLRAAYDGAWLRLMDGQLPRALARRLFGLALPHAAGSDVTDLLLRRHVRPQDRVTVIGGSGELVSRLKEMFGLREIAHLNPSMGFIARPAEVAACVDFVIAHPARYVFLVVGAPQSEYLAHEVALRGGAVGCGLCVGSSLSFSTGMVPRAPQLMRRLGLEGVYRLALNPRAHARRVFIDSLPILWIALRVRFDPSAYGIGKARR